MPLNVVCLGIKMYRLLLYPEKDKTEYLKELINDATKKGAKIINKDGGTI